MSGTLHEPTQAKPSIISKCTFPAGLCNLDVKSTDGCVNEADRKGRTSSAMAKLNFSTSSVMRWSAFVSPAAHMGDSACFIYFAAMHALSQTSLIG